MFGARQATWYNRLEADHDNLRAALRWTLESQEAEMGLRLVSVLYRFWRLRNHAHEGRSWYEQVLAQPGAEARTVVRARALRGAGFLAFAQGDYPEAQQLLEESVSVGREVGAAGKRELASALATLAHVSLLQGNPGAALELAGESLQLFQEIGEAWGTALALHHLGKATIELGDPEAASPLLEESAALFRKTGDKQLLAQSLNTLGMAALRQSDDSGARARFEEALAVAQETGAEQFIADALAHLGTVALRVDDYQQAAALYGQSLAINGDLGNRDGIAEDLAGVAAVASLLGQAECAARLFGAVEVLREVSNIALPPLRRTEYDHTMAGIRAQLDEAAFATAWAQGRAMPLEQTIAYALETKDALPTDTKPLEEDAEKAEVLSSPTLSSSRALKQHFGGLTAREREVARLVAQGKSNRAIADELVVGISTVEAHITHIFTKLGFSSRAQIAAWAVDKGLAKVQQDGDLP
jgi:DNA-binding CsgD family transcriptional regulator